MRSIKQQTSKEPFWKDETGTDIPYNRTTTLERTKEKTAFKLAKEALDINSRLIAFKQRIADECAAIYEEAMKDATKPGKGNFTLFNFDASIKIEVQINEQIAFDSVQIELAKQKLESLIGESITTEKEFIKELVLSAFQTSKGGLDTKKVLGLKKHASRIKDARYHEAMELIDKSIRRPSSKTYFKVFLKAPNGQYDNIDLNFSSL